MDWLRIIYWISLAIVWVELVFVWWLIGKNKRRLRELNKLEALYATTIRELDSIRDSYIAKMLEIEGGVSDEG